MLTPFVCLKKVSKWGSKSDDSPLNPIGHPPIKTKPGLMNMGSALGVIPSFPAENQQDFQQWISSPRSSSREVPREQTASPIHSGRRSPPQPRQRKTRPSAISRMRCATSEEGPRLHVGITQGKSTTHKRKRNFHCHKVGRQETQAQIIAH